MPSASGFLEAALGGLAVVAVSAFVTWLRKSYTRFASMDTSLKQLCGHVDEALSRIDQLEARVDQLEA